MKQKRHKIDIMSYWTEEDEQTEMKECFQAGIQDNAAPTSTKKNTPATSDKELTVISAKKSGAMASSAAAAIKEKVNSESGVAKDKDNKRSTPGKSRTLERRNRILERRKLKEQQASIQSSTAVRHAAEEDEEADDCSLNNIMSPAVAPRLQFGQNAIADDNDALATSDGSLDSYTRPGAVSVPGLRNINSGDVDSGDYHQVEAEAHAETPSEIQVEAYMVEEPACAHVIDAGCQLQEEEDIPTSLLLDLQSQRRTKLFREFGYSENYGVTTSTVISNQKRGLALEHADEWFFSKLGEHLVLMTSDDRDPECLHRQNNLAELGRQCRQGRELLGIRDYFQTCRHDMGWKSDYGKLTSTNSSNEKRKEANQKALKYTAEKHDRYPFEIESWLIAAPCIS